MNVQNSFETFGFWCFKVGLATQRQSCECACVRERECICASVRVRGCVSRCYCHMLYDFFSYVV